jgi:hypothetical protein
VIDTIIFTKYIVWTDYGSEGWSPTGFDNWEEAVDYWKQNANKSVITEYIPVVIADGRKPQNTNNLRSG